MNGQFSKNITYTYTLIPVREGTLKIPPLPVRSGSDTVWTREIKIQVSPQTKGDADAAKDDVFVQARISDPAPYQGQQLVYTFRLYQSAQIANARFDKPKFDGFTAKQIDKERNFNTVSDGRRYHITELNYLLIPLNPGEKTIEPAELQCDLVVRNPAGRRRSNLLDDFFNNMPLGGGRLEPRIFRTDAISVNIRPLPPYTGNGNFSGLVGQFDLQAGVETKDLKVGDSVTLSLTLTGTGNIIDAAKPEIKIPEELKVYEDSPEEDFQLGQQGYSGKKVFRTALVPVKPGTMTLPPVELVYFDTAQGQYITRQTRPLTLNVSPSSEKETLETASAPSSEPANLPKKKVEFTGRDIFPLKEGLDSLENRQPLSPVRFAVLILGPALFCLLLRFGLAATRKSDTPARIMSERAEKALRNAQSNFAENDDFLLSLYRALISAILSKAGTTGESLTSIEAGNILRASGYGDDIIDTAARLQERIESSKFGGIILNDESKQQLLTETRQLVRNILK